MPNYSIIANTRFQNRSFDDLLKPLAMYTQEYNTLENALGELDTKASVWEGMANEQTDPEAYAQYKRYADDLRGQATALAQNGLNINTNRDLLKMRRRYASEIAPIEQAYTSRKAQADEQRKAMLQNPTLLLSRRADMTSLDDYLRNPQLGYDSYSGALLTQQVGTAAATIAKELRDYGNGKKLDGFTKTWLQQHGFTAAEVAQAINHPDSPKSANVLNTLVNNVIADSGIPEWADRPTLNQAYSYARQGLWQAVGQTNVQTYTDEAAKLAAQEASQKRLANYQAGIASANARRDKGNIPIFSDRINSPDMEGEKGKKMGTRMQQFINGLNKNTNGQYTANLRVNNDTRAGISFYSGNSSSPRMTNVSLPLTDRSGGVLTEYEFVSRAKKILSDNGVLLTEEGYNKHKVPGTPWTKNENYQSYMSRIDDGLKKYYQDNLGKFLKDNGLDATPVMGAHSRGVQRLNISDVLTTAEKAASGEGPYRVNAIELRFGEGRSKNKEVFEGLMPTLVSDGDNTYIKRVRRIAPDGTIELESRNLPYNKFIDSKGSALSTPTFWRINTPGGKNGILLRMSDGMYYVPGDYLGNTFRESNVDVDALVQLQAMKDRIIEQYGEDAYYSSQQGLKIEEAMDQYGASSVRGGGVSISGGYKLPGYSLVETSEDQLE